MITTMKGILLSHSPTTYWITPTYLFCKTTSSSTLTISEIIWESSPILLICCTGWFLYTNNWSCSSGGGKNVANSCAENFNDL